MNIHKHMEAIFVVTLAVAGAGKYALDSLPSAPARASAAAQGAKTAAVPASAPAAAPRA
jgi:hypothetical protein